LPTHIAGDAEAFPAPESSEDLPTRMNGGADEVGDLSTVAGFSALEPGLPTRMNGAADEVFTVAAFGDGLKRLRTGSLL